MYAYSEKQRWEYFELGNAFAKKSSHAVCYTINRKRKVGSEASKETDETVGLVGFPSSPQPTIKSAFAKNTDAITQFLCKDNVAFNAVSRPGFQNLINVL
jgi:hypothetical protein